MLFAHLNSAPSCLLRAAAEASGSLPLHECGNESAQPLIGLQVFNGEQSIKEEAFSKFVKWPVSSQIIEAHFKIINDIYPVGRISKK